MSPLSSLTSSDHLIAPKNAHWTIPPSKKTSSTHFEKKVFKVSFHGLFCFSWRIVFRALLHSLMKAKSLVRRGYPLVAAQNAHLIIPPSEKPSILYLEIITVKVHFHGLFCFSWRIVFRALLHSLMKAESLVTIGYHLIGAQKAHLTIPPCHHKLSLFFELYSSALRFHEKKCFPEEFSSEKKINFLWSRLESKCWQ